MYKTMVRSEKHLSNILTQFERFSFTKLRTVILINSEINKY